MALRTPRLAARAACRCSGPRAIDVQNVDAATVEHQPLGLPPLTVAPCGTRWTSASDRSNVRFDGRHGHVLDVSICWFFGVLLDDG